MKTVQIFFIHTDKCKDCKKALSTIESAILQCRDVECEVLKYNFDTKVGLNICINNDIDDIPGIVVGSDGTVFKGKKYSEKRIVEAIKKASRVSKDE